MTERRATKVQEFMANSPEVLCARFNYKGPSLLATGGSDHKVGVWRTSGAYSCLASLGGPQKPVTAVTFSRAQGTSDAIETIVGGDASGVLRVWDLARQQEVRHYNQSCHKGQVTRVDHHPFGNFFASTSTDGNVKVWDLRKKTCLQTYKYQEGKEAGNPAINFIRFSPDGRMVASGNADGTVVLWDLTMGKRLHKLSWHRDAVTSIDYHPQEFILAVGSADGAVSFWNIEDWSRLTKTPAAVSGAGPLQLSFDMEGTALLAGHSQGLDVLGWGGVSNHDSVAQSWGNIGAMCCGRESMYAATFTKSFVSIYSVKLGSLVPFSASSQDAKSTPASRKSPTTGARPATQETVSSPLLARPGGAGAGAAGVAPAQQQQQQQQPGLHHPHLQQRPASSGKAVPSSSGDGSLPSGARQQQQQQPQALPSSSGGAAAQQQQAPGISSGDAGGVTDAPVFGRRGSTPPSALPEGARVYHDSRGGGGGGGGSPTVSRRRTEPSLLVRQGSGGGVGGFGQRQQQHQQPQEQLAPPVKPVDAFVSVLDVKSDAQAVGHALSDAPSFQHIMASRLTAVQTARSLFFNDPPEALRFVADASKADPGIAADFLAGASQPKVKKSLTLDVSCLLLPLIADLLSDKFESYIIVAVQAARSILAVNSVLMGRYSRQKTFGKSDEEEARAQRYRSLHGAFLKLQGRLDHISRHSKLAGDEAVRLSKDISAV